MNPTDKIFLNTSLFMCMLIVILPEGIAFGIVGFSGYNLTRKSKFSVKIEGQKKEVIDLRFSVLTKSPVL